MQPVYILNSSNIAQRKRLDMVADNVANANTAGFKQQQMSFQEVLGGRNVPSAQVGRFTQDTGLTYGFEQGSLNSTGNPFDLAINGDAFFPIDVNGNVHYTRNGHFTMNANGDLITETGNPVLDNNGAAINIPPNTKFTVTGDGTVVTPDGPIGQVGMLQFANKNSLVRAGANTFTVLNGEEPVPAPIGEVSVLQGFLEDSNVNAIKESVNLTEVQRAYVSTAKLIKNIEDLEQRAIRQLARSQ